MNKIPKTPIILVDGSSYLYRAFHAFPPLTNTKGEPTGAMYGVLNMIRSLRTKIKPSHMVVVFDAKGKTFRDDLYAKYKANRPSMPNDLRTQVEPLYNMLKAQGYPIIIMDNVEADDVIGSLAIKFAEDKKNVLISTGDKDMAQLVGPYITLINTMNNLVLDREGVIEKFGIPPEFIIDYLALMGDSSDNIPGVPGVGEKTAKALIQGLGNLEQIYQNIEQVKELPIRGAKTLAEKLIQAKEMAELSYKLATIKTDLDIGVSLEQLIFSAEDIDKLKNYYQEYNFNKWLKELSLEPTSNNLSFEEIDLKPTTKNNYRQIYKNENAIQNKPVNKININYDNYSCVLTPIEFDQLLEKLEHAKYFAFDTETDSLNYMQANLVGISFALDDHSAYYIPLAHDYMDVPTQLDFNIVLTKLAPILANLKIGKIGQNIKYDMNVLAKYNIKITNIIADTMLESYVLNSLTKHNLDDLSLTYLGHKTILYTEIVGKGKNQLTFNQIDVDMATKYAAEDADITMYLHKYLEAELTKEPTLQSVYQDLELPLINVLSKMELTGVLLDQDLLNQLSMRFNARLQELEQMVFILAGKPFNLSSPKQLQQILFSELNLPVIQKTASGVPSTNEEVLQELSSQYELPKLILEYRSLSKLKSTYTDKLPLMVDPKTKRIHTSYNQAITTTGRLSSSDPNLQNIPVKTQEGREIRKAFIAKDGFKIISADYSQIELRIMAHLSKDKGMIDAFKHNLDIHRATAAEIFQVDLAEVTNEQRRSAKAINFGLIYGMSAFGLAKQLNISRTQAQTYIDLYFSRYPGVLNYMQQIKQVALEQGYVETLFKRRLYLTEIHSKNMNLRKGAERLAINAPMQGTAADIIKKAMIDLSKKLEHKTDEINMLMQVHDELIFEVDVNKVEMYSQLIKETMETVILLDIPLIVDVGVGDNWGDAH